MTSLPPVEMMSKTRFADLVHLLADLGYTLVRQPGSHVRFVNVLPRQLLLLNEYQDGDLVAPDHMAGIRHSLEAHGLMEPAEFDERVRQLAAEGAA